jgi:serine/threonine-protein kinase
VLLVVGLVAVLAVGSIWLMASASAPRSVAVPVTTPSADEAPPSAPPVTTAPATTVAVPVEYVPDAGGHVDAFTAALSARGLTLGAVTRTPSALAAGSVLSSSPSAGAAAPVGTPVDVVVASGQNLVPSAAGLDATGAAAALRAAGFEVALATPTGEAPMSGATVVAMSPEAGTSLPLGQTVQVVLQNPAPQPTTAPAPTSTPTPAPSPTPTITPAPTATPGATR